MELFRNIPEMLCSSNSDFIAQQGPPTKIENDYAGECKITESDILCDDFELYQEDYFDKKYLDFQKPKYLFNLYSYIIDDLNHTPILIIKDCEFKHFLRDYKTLINFEEDNHQFNDDILVKYRDYGGKIEITDSIFSFSRFCQGLLIYMNDNSAQSADNYEIKITGSQFNELNVFNQRDPFQIREISLSDNTFLPHIHTLYETEANPDGYQFIEFFHKGIISLHNFPGPILIQECSFTYVSFK